MSRREPLSHRESWAQSPHARRLRIEALEDRRMLAVLTVQNNLDDTLANLAGDGELSLREAMEIANNPGMVIDGFSSGDEADEIVFASPYFDTARTIALQAGELGHDETLNINGPGQELLTIDAQQNSRVLQASVGSGDFTLSGLTITGGTTSGSFAKGGGILLASAAELTLVSTTVSGNTTTADFANGGGIYTLAGTITLIDSTVHGNKTTGHYAGGGGISTITGAITLTNSTVSGNQTMGSIASGGGIHTAEGTVSLTNSTVSGNTTDHNGGGIFLFSGSMSLASSTITRNEAPEGSGGGVFQFFHSTDSSINVEHSIIAGNQARVGGQDLKFESLASIDYSLVGDTTGTSIDATSGVGNLLNVNPLLGPLADHGGATQSHSLLAGSPAIDAGNPTVAMHPTNDQRGAPFERLADGNGNGSIVVDMGAFEVPDTLFVDTEQDFLNESDGVTSLREAINTANLTGKPNHILFDASLSGETITLNGSELLITDSLSIDATNLPEKVTIDANQQSRVINIDAETGDYSLSGLVITGGQTVEPSPWSSRTRGVGGGVRSITRDTLGIYESVVEGNTTLGSRSSGGGIYAEKGKFTLYRSTVRNNTSEDGWGGGLAVVGNFISPGFNSVIEGNSVIEQSTISNNRASEAGGGIYLAGRASQVISSTISSNQADGIFGGGGIHSAGFDLYVDQSTIFDNHATFHGAFAWGGGLIGGRSLEVSRSIIAGNTAVAGGNDLIHSNPTLNYSLIGDTTDTDIDSNTGIGNILNVNPLLGPLADNGGPTQTHALLPGSPAIDAGDPLFEFDLNDFDQRGQPFLRVADGNLPDDIAIDIGAYEAQSVATADFDADGDVDGTDFLTWQRGYGMQNAVRSDGNSDDDADVDASDLAAWTLTYGEGAAVAISSQSAGGSQELLGVARAWTLLGEERDEPMAMLVDLPSSEPVVVREDRDVRFLGRAHERNDYRKFAEISDSHDVTEPWLSGELLERVFAD